MPIWENLPDELSVEDTAEILDLAARTVRTMVDAGVLSARRIGKRAYAISKESVRREHDLRMQQGARKRRTQYTSPDQTK